MQNREEFVHAAHLYLNASKLIMSTWILQERIQVCHKELARILDSECSTQSQLAHIHDLNDEIWGCKIELQSIHLKAKRLVKKARYERFSFIDKREAKSFACTQ